jgi:hypothetical protein
MMFLPPGKYSQYPDDRHFAGGITWGIMGDKKEEKVFYLVRYFFILLLHSATEW